jgi:hypothetical protein
MPMPPQMIPTIARTPEEQQQRRSENRLTAPRIHAVVRLLEF